MYVLLHSRSSLNLSDANIAAGPGDGRHADGGKATLVLAISNFSPSNPRAID